MPGTGFSVVVRHLPGVAVLDLAGDLNTLAEGDLSRAYAQAVEAKPGHILLNFTDVGYINSTGIALIVGLLANARKARRSLGVYGLSEHYQEIFRITRLADFMALYPDEASAVTSAAGSSV